MLVSLERTRHERNVSWDTNTSICSGGYWDHHLPRSNQLESPYWRLPVHQKLPTSGHGSRIICIKQTRLEIQGQKLRGLSPSRQEPKALELVVAHLYL